MPFLVSLMGEVEGQEKGGGGGGLVGITHGGSGWARKRWGED